MADNKDSSAKKQKVEEEKAGSSDQVRHRLGRLQSRPRHCRGF